MNVPINVLAMMLWGAATEWGGEGGINRGGGDGAASPVATITRVNVMVSLPVRLAEMAMATMACVAWADALAEMAMATMACVAWADAHASALEDRDEAVEHVCGLLAQVTYLHKLEAMWMIELSFRWTSALPLSLSRKALFSSSPDSGSRPRASARVMPTGPSPDTHSLAF